VPARRAGRLLLVEPRKPVGEAARTLIYTRVWSAALDRQVARLNSGVSGVRVAAVVAGVGLAMNGCRCKLGRVLADRGAVRIVVGYRGRLARFGVGHLRAALAAQGRRIMIIGPGKLDGGLVRNPSEVLTSFCARRYGRRGHAAGRWAHLDAFSPPFVAAEV
jgi:putative resolvase